MNFNYQSETFGKARRILMLPSPHGEAVAIMLAFHECGLGLHQLNEEGSDARTREKIKRLKELMDTKEIEDPEKRGRWIIKAEQFSMSEKRELSDLVDELASLFDRKFYDRAS